MSCMAVACLNFGFSPQSTQRPRKYEVCLAYELTEPGLATARQISLPFRCPGVKFDGDCRIEAWMGKAVISTPKAVDRLESILEAHLLSSLKLSRCRVGLLINSSVQIPRNVFAG